MAKLTMKRFCKASQTFEKGLLLDIEWDTHGVQTFSVVIDKSNLRSDLPPTLRCGTPAAAAGSLIAHSPAAAAISQQLTPPARSLSAVPGPPFK